MLDKVVNLLDPLPALVKLSERRTTIITVTEVPSVTCGNKRKYCYCLSNVVKYIILYAFHIDMLSLAYIAKHYQTRVVC